MLWIYSGTQLYLKTFCFLCSETWNGASLTYSGSAYSHLERNWHMSFAELDKTL
jgi:hypothetical protein